VKLTSLRQASTVVRSKIKRKKRRLGFPSACRGGFAVNGIRAGL
jgi:hypothetical protein